MGYWLALISLSATDCSILGFSGLPLFMAEAGNLLVGDPFTPLPSSLQVVDGHPSFLSITYPQEPAEKSEPF